MRRFLTVAMMIAALIIIMPAFAEEKIIVVQSFSPLSKADAIRTAQRMAVEQAVGVFIKSETEVENFALKKDKIFSRTEGYITRYDILSDKKTDGDFVVVIRATVSLDKIKDDLLAMKILLESMDRPKLMILVEEEYKSMDDLGMAIAGTELSARLSALGFDLVDKAQLESAKSRDQARQAMAGNEKAAASLGLNFGAQYVILGKAVAQDAGEAFKGSGLKSIQASLQLKVIQTQTGSVLGSVVKNGVSANISPLTGATIAFQDIVRKAVNEYIVDVITHSFQDFLNNGAPLKLHVTGINSFREYKQVVKSVESLSRVASCRKESWNKAGGILVLDLRFKGISDELAELLDGRQLNPNSLEVVDLSPNRVDCRFSK